MANSPNPTPPNRRRRLTADELIAIVVAIAGIGTVFFWGIGQKNGNLFQRGITSLGGDNANRPGGLLTGGDTNVEQERRTIASIAQKDRQNSTVATTTNPTPTTTVKTVEVPADETTAPVAVAPPAVVSVLPIVKTPTFTDVPQQFWGATYITELQKRGILDDFGTTNFEPNKPITRGEYAKMLDRAFADRQINSTASNFTDIPADYPRKEALGKSVQRGFMTGYPSQKFAPNQSIPRVQLQISLVKGLQLPTPTSTEQVLSKFTDAKDIPKYARDKMAAAVDAGLVIKDKATDRLNPMQTATRADAAVSIYEALVKEGKIKPQQ